MKTRTLTPALLVAALAVLPAMAYDKADAQKKLEAAQDILAAAVEAPDRGIPRELMERAECIGVFPSVAKGAFVVGGTHGRGVFTCRKANGEMGSPLFFTIGGASVGWQFGGESADLVLLVMNRNGMENLLADQFTLGANASATAGPVGRTAKAATDAHLKAQVLSWSRSQGAFLGASLEGAVIKPHQEANEVLYGKPVTAREVLVDNRFSTPAMAESFVSTVRRESNRHEG